MLADSRPALLIRDDQFSIDAFDGYWGEKLSAARQPLESAIRATGGIETLDETVPFVGTGFLIEPALVVTADFVARALLSNVDGSLTDAWVNFRGEAHDDRESRYRITEVLDLDERARVAILRIDAASHRDPLEIADGGPRPEMDLCVVNYASNDLRNKEARVIETFGELFNIKRLSPGKVLGLESNEFKHDASTIGGASGSPVINVDGRLLGMHIGGQFLSHNSAIYGSIIRQRLNAVLSQPARPQDPTAASVLSRVSALKVPAGSAADDTPLRALGQTVDTVAQLRERREIFGIDGVI